MHDPNMNQLDGMFPAAFQVWGDDLDSLDPGLALHSSAPEIPQVLCSQNDQCAFQSVMGLPYVLVPLILFLHYY